MSDGFDRNAARERLDAATPGPWGLPSRVRHDDCGARTPDGQCDHWQPFKDAEFIAHAPADLRGALDLLDAIAAWTEDAHPFGRDAYISGYTEAMLSVRRLLDGDSE